MPLHLERVSAGDLITARSFNVLLDTLDALDARLTQIEGQDDGPVITERVPIITMGPPGLNTIAFTPPGDPNGRAIAADRTGTVNVKVETGQAGSYRYEATVDNGTAFTVRDVTPGNAPQAPPFVQDVAIEVYATLGGGVAPNGTLTVTAYRLRADGSDGVHGSSGFPIRNRGIVI